MKLSRNTVIMVAVLSLLGIFVPDYSSRQTKTR